MEGSLSNLLQSPTFWQAVSALATIAAAVIYLFTLRRLTGTHETLTKQTELSRISAHAQALSVIVEQISNSEQREFRNATIYSEKSIPKINREQFRRVVNAYDRAALLTMNDDQLKRSLLKFQEDAFTLIYGKYRPIISEFRNDPKLERRDYAAHLLELCEWGVAEGIIKLKEAA